MASFIERVNGRLIVSAQAYPGEPMRHPETLVQIAEAAVNGGAAAIRLQGIADVRLGAERLSVPVIGLWKDGDTGVYITPTAAHALAVAEAGADVVAVDATRRPRPDGRTLGDTIRAVHDESAALVMADCGSLEDALFAVDSGADLVGTTLAGYSDDRPKTTGPDLELIAAIAAAGLGVPLIAEGRIHTPEQAAQAMQAGADSVVVGTAITHPTTITGWFAAALAQR